jgi:DNA-binding PadR family transcriptional regulator
MYGYQIIKELERRSEGYFKFKEGTLYPALHRLERSGLISGEWEKLPGELERRYYCLTDKGAKALREKITEWHGFTTAMDKVAQSLRIVLPELGRVEG